MRQTKKFDRDVVLPLETGLKRRHLDTLECHRQSRISRKKMRGKMGVIMPPLHPLFDWLRDQKSFSETYLAVKGAACILPQSECLRTITKGSHGGDMQTHLQSMYYLLRNQDTIKVAVKIESMYPDHNRYLVVVSTIDRQDTEESIILGVDVMDDQATIGLVLTIWGDMTIRLDGDGGFSLSSNDRHHIFKPVSVQAMWSALQSLIRVRNIAQRNNYYPKGLTHTWVTYYEVRIKSEQSCINEWNAMEDIESQRTGPSVVEGSLEKAQVEKAIKSKLKAIMMAVDLEEVTSVYLRSRLEETMGMSLTEYKPFIDEEMIVIMRQMDAASEIFDYLYLGSEWNASNLEELQEQGVGNILNMAREIDNFFPGVIDYYNVRVYDVEHAELIRHWEDTFKFINRVKQQRQKVLVHCKMGVSRSACTVMAYAMKEYGWTLEQAYQFVKQKRSCIKPNAGFMNQLIIYQGILDASKQRHNKLWRSVSVGNLNEMTRRREDSGESSEDEKQSDEFLDLSRPRSWTPHNCELHCRRVRGADKDDASSTDGRQVTGAHAVNSPLAERSGTCGASSTTGEVALFTLDEDSVTTDQNAVQKPCANTSSNQPVVNTTEWCVAPHGAVSSVRKVEEWMEKTSLEGILESTVAIDSVAVDNSVESPTLSRASVHQEKSKVHCGTDNGCSELLASTQLVHSVSAAALLTSKVRPDNSWIKDELQVPSDGTTAEEDTSNPIADDKPEVVESVAMATQDLTNQNVDSGSEDGKSSVKSDSEAKSKEIGVVEHYEKEQIPWNTGTVRRQTQDLEERLKSGLKLCSDTSSPVSSIGSPMSVHNDFNSVTVSNSPSADLAGSCGDDPLLMSPERSSTSNDVAKRPVSSIYANEDIPLEPGIVMRTKQDIEERTKKISDVDESRPVQRSSSWKVGQVERSQKRRNRNSDRRKTCQPVLQHASFVDNATHRMSDSVFSGQPRRCSAGEERKEQSPTDDKCEVKVYQIGSEQVEMQKDKVKRRTKDFEELSKEEQDERASPALAPSTQELKRSHSPFPGNNELKIRTGSVLEQKLTIEMKYGTTNESSHAAAKSTQPTDIANTNDESQHSIDLDSSVLDTNLSVETTSGVLPCHSCGSHRRAVDGSTGYVKGVKPDDERVHPSRAGEQSTADYGDKCGDAECKYCSRVLGAYYRVGDGSTRDQATENSLQKVGGCAGQTRSAGKNSEFPVGFLTSPQRLPKFVSDDATSLARTNVGDIDGALLYSSNYSLPGVPRKTAVSPPSRGTYPTHDVCPPGVGASCGDKDVVEDISNNVTPSQKSTHFQNDPETLECPGDIRTEPVLVYQKEDTTSRVTTTWQQRHTEPGGNDEAIDLSSNPPLKMDARTLTLICSVASTFQHSPDRSRGIVRRIARDVESGMSLQPFCPDVAPDLPKSMPPELPKSMPPGLPKSTPPDLPKSTPPDLPKSMPPNAYSNTEIAPHQSYASCSKSPAVLASNEPVSTCVAMDVDAPSQSFTTSRELQLNTDNALPVGSTETPECEVGLETSSHESSPPPTDDSRVRNLVEIFEPKDGASIRQPGGVAGSEASIVKRLTWHAGDRTKPKFEVKKVIAPFNDDSSVESPPGRRRTLSDKSVGDNASDQARRHATPTDGDNKFVTKLVELCTVPEATSLQQQGDVNPTEVPGQLRSSPAVEEHICHGSSLHRPWEARIPINMQREPDPSQVPRKTRKLQGKSHPLSKLSGETSQLGRSVNPFYNTM